MQSVQEQIETVWQTMPIEKPPRARDDTIDHDTVRHPMRVLFHHLTHSLVIISLGPCPTSELAAFDPVAFLPVMIHQTSVDIQAFTRPGESKLLVEPTPLAAATGTLTAGIRQLGRRRQRDLFLERISCLLTLLGVLAFLADARL